MLLSDRDIRAELAAGRIKLEPYDASLLQPSSVDLRLDRYFRTFVNHRYTHIDPATQQDDLTAPVEVEPDESFVLHPGEFVLGSTYEVITLPDDVAGRLEGKALALDTPVPTPDGWQTMGDLRVGDEVFDETGAPTPIVAVTGVLTDRPCYEVELSDHTVLIADAAHQWLTRTQAERTHGQAGSVRTTAQLAGDLRAGAEWNHHLPLAGPLQHPHRDLPIDPYLLGLWLGDGTTSSALLTTANPEVRGHVPTAADGSLQHALQALGLPGHPHVPEQYLTAAPEQRLALLQGLMDSGGDCNEVGHCAFVSTREALAQSVVRLAAGLGLGPMLRKQRALLDGVEVGPAYQITFVAQVPVFRLQRPLARQRQQDARMQRHRAIVAVRPVPTVPVRCIEVASPRGLFLVGDTCVVTHNSSLGRLGLLTHSTAGFIDPGFSGHVTLELSNVANLPIILWPGMKVGQLCLFRLSSPAEHPYGSAIYGSRYQGQRGPTPSRSFQSFRKGLT